MLKKQLNSFKYAYEGLAWAFRTQPNYRIHLLVSILSVVSSYVFKISYEEFLVILVLILIGLVIETINTALEETTNAIDRNWRQDIKLAKDLAAASMLLFAIGSSIIALIIFVPKVIFFIQLYL